MGLTARDPGRHQQIHQSVAAGDPEVVRKRDRAWFGLPIDGLGRRGGHVVKRAAPVVQIDQDRSLAPDRLGSESFRLGIVTRQQKR